MNYCHSFSIFYHTLILPRPLRLRSDCMFIYGSHQVQVCDGNVTSVRTGVWISEWRLCGVFNTSTPVANHLYSVHPPVSDCKSNHLQDDPSSYAYREMKVSLSVFLFCFWGCGSIFVAVETDSRHRFESWRNEYRAAEPLLWQIQMRGSRGDYSGIFGPYRVSPHIHPRNGDWCWTCSQGDSGD